MPSIADFSINIDKGYAGASTFTFTNQSTSDMEDTAAWEYLWDFGDGTTSEEENPTHTYSAEGDYTIILTTNDGTDIEPPPDSDLPPLTNTVEEDVTIYSTASIGGDAHATASSAMKQYGNTDESIVYVYNIPINIDRALQGNETMYIHGTQIPEDFMLFQNLDPNDLEHYNSNLSSTDYDALLTGCPVEEWDIGTHTIILTLTMTLNNDETFTYIKTFDLTFSNHPHMPLWGDDPETTATVGEFYNQTVKAIDDDLMGDSEDGNESLTLMAQESGEIGETGIIAKPLPSWVSAEVGSTIQEQIDGKTKSTCTITLSGTPGENDVGGGLVTLVATDSYGLQMIKCFGLTVSE